MGIGKGRRKGMRKRGGETETHASGNWLKTRSDHARVPVWPDYY